MAGGGRALAPSPDGTPPRHDRHEERRTTKTKKKKKNSPSSLLSASTFPSSINLSQLTKIRSRGVARAPPHSLALGSSIGASNDSGGTRSGALAPQNHLKHHLLAAGSSFLPPPPNTHKHTQGHDLLRRRRRLQAVAAARGMTLGRRVSHNRRGVRIPLMPNCSSSSSSGDGLAPAAPEVELGGPLTANFFVRKVESTGDSAAQV